MKEVDYTKLCVLIKEYIQQNETFLNDAKAYIKVNKTVKKINEIITKTANQGNIYLKELIDKLLSERDIRLYFYGAILAIHRKYKVKVAFNIMKEMANNNEYEFTRGNAERFLDLYANGYKPHRDESYPDLSEYEKE